MRMNKLKLDLYRARRGITIKDLAQKANCSYKTLQCKDEVGPLAVGRIAKALGIDPEELIIEEVAHVSTSR